jgi:putative peptidoglycan lipid II flippase
MNKPRTPLRVSLLGIGLNLIMNVALVKVLHMGHVGLALSTATLAVVNFLQLLFYLRADIGLGTLRNWAGFAGRVGIATVVSALLAWLAAHWAGGLASGFPGLLLALGAGIPVGGLVYVVCTLVLRVPEIEGAWKAVRRKLGRQ